MMNFQKINNKQKIYRKNLKMFNKRLRKLNKRNKNYKINYNVEKMI